MENLTAVTNIVAMPTGAITVDEIKDSIKGGKEAQIRQVFTKSYPKMRTSNEFKDSLFSDEELGIEADDYTEERVTWIPVGKTHKVEDVKAALAKNAESVIYKVLSNNPIVSSDQQRVLDNGLTGDAFDNFLSTNGLNKSEWDEECSKILYDKIASRQLVVYAEGEQEGQPILYNGKEQYREVFFSKTARPDMDLRTTHTRQESPELVLATEEVKVTA